MGPDSLLEAGRDSLSSGRRLDIFIGDLFVVRIEVDLAEQWMRVLLSKSQDANCYYSAPAPMKRALASLPSSSSSSSCIPMLQLMRYGTKTDVPVLVEGFACA